MTRARVLGALLALILLGCGVVIFLDQQGAFGGTTTPTVGPAVPDGSPPATDSTGDDGYENLR